jgi:hypothetical protein
VLTVVAVLAAIGAMLLERSSTPDTAVSDGGLLYPGLKSILNDVERLELSGPDAEEKVILERREPGWVVVPKSGYPADSGKIRRLLLRLAEARTVEVKTANPELYSRLGVADSGDGAGTLLIVGPPANVSLIVGARDAAGGSGTYVRRQGEEQSYLIDADLEVKGTETDWLYRELFDVDAGDISKVVIVHGDGEMIELIRVGDRLVVAGIPPGRELSSPGATQPIARALAALRFDDVVPASEFDASDPEATVEFHIDDGRRITAQAWRKDNTRWLAFNVALDPAPEPPADEAESEPGGTQDPDAVSPAGEPAGEDRPARVDPQSVAQQDAALAGWVYEVPVQRYEQMVRRMEDLLKPGAE